MAIDFSKFTKFEPPQKKPSSYHTSDIREIEALQVTIEEMGPPISLYIVMKKPLQVGVSLQIQFDVTPCSFTGGSGHDGSPWAYDIATVAGQTAYTCIVNSVKARIKPGSAEFDQSEEESLDEIINEPESEEINRFTGLEL